ncbi:MAG: PHP domain-containing protein [Breznakiellaceae bacterium]|jgi:predicted metal-dependent phosphoesterase TrpH
MKANLHFHSRFSDGTQWPSEIVQRAYGAGKGRYELLALTDHDTFGGVPEFLKACAIYGIQGIPAVEIDVVDPHINYKSELLAYFPQGSYQQTAQLLHHICQERQAYVRESLLKAQHHFVRKDLRFEHLFSIKQRGRPEVPAEFFSFNKVDLYYYFKNAGVIPADIEYRAFKKAYLDSRLIAGPSYPKPTCTEVIEQVHRDGGFVVLPHIGHEFEDSWENLKKDQKRFLDMLSYFKNLGIDGIELYWYRNGDTKEINSFVEKVAPNFGFFFTYGSDCHGPDSGKDTLLLFSGNFRGWPAPRISA